MKPFNLKEAKAGKLVCTRDGHPIRILCFDALNELYPIVALIKRNNCEEPITFTIDGYVIDGDRRADDLMMATVKKEGYIALIKPQFKDTNIIMSTTNAYPSAEICHERFSKLKGYIKTIKIEWEE